jgi:hypothetical protein
MNSIQPPCSKFAEQMRGVQLAETKHIIREPQNKNPRGMRPGQKATQSMSCRRPLAAAMLQSLEGKLIVDHRQSAFARHVFRTRRDVTTLFALSHRMRQGYYAQFARIGLPVNGTNLDAGAVSHRAGD